jgi:ketol-acid reductoisomerase
MRDNGLNVIVGVRENGQSWKEALDDGWVPGKNLFGIDEAIGKATVVMNLLSDAAQSETWPAIKPQLKGKVSISMLANFILQSLKNSDSLLLPRFLARLQGPHQGRSPHRH